MCFGVLWFYEDVVGDGFVFCSCYYGVVLSESIEFVEVMFDVVL